MKLLSFEHTDPMTPSWTMSKIRFKTINLFVGASGSGKTRALNAIFNIGKYVASGEGFRRGWWRFEFENNGNTYIWEYEGHFSEDGNPCINKELIEQTDPDGRKVILVDRTKGQFIFNETDLPKLPSASPSIYLLKEEASIEPLYRQFARIMRRNFFGGDLEQACAYHEVPGHLIHAIKNNKKPEEFLFRQELGLSARLFLLEQFFPQKYKVIGEYFKSVFPTVETYQILESGQLNRTRVVLIPDLPVFAIKEKGINTFIGLQELSSGMRKVLLLLTDILMLPGNVLYLIDEYENSLGINAINFLPPFLLDHGDDNQFIITSHHPYLINNIPVRNWHVFHRKGSHVFIKSGDELEQTFGKSKQRAFIQLINDPFYTEGIE